MRVLVNGLGVCLGLLIALGYLGALHPMGDSFAVFRLPLLVLFALVVVWSGWIWWLRWALAGAAMAAMLPFVAEGLAPTAPSQVPALSLYQQNLRFNRSDRSEWLALVQDRSPDVITLQEVSGPNKTLLSDLVRRYPTQHYCDFAGVGGVAVLSRFAGVAGSALCADRNGLAAIQVETGIGPLWLVSLHLHWPWPYRQAEQLEQLLPVLAALNGPVVLAGDFNAVGWSHAMAQVEDATGSRRAPGYQATFHLPKIAMPVTIDHALAPADWAAHVQRMPKAGSDHHGLLVRVGP